MHINNKTLAREKKIADKIRAKTDPEFRVAVFDLEKVLQTSQSEVNSFYYKRKLSTLPFIISGQRKVTASCGMRLVNVDQTKFLLVF